MQDDIVQPLFSIEESMKIAADLKLDRHLTEARKYEIVSYLYDTIIYH